MKVSLTVLCSYKNKHLQNIIRHENGWREIFNIFSACMRLWSLRWDGEPRIAEEALYGKLFMATVILMAIKTFHMNSWKHLLRIWGCYLETTWCDVISSAAIDKSVLFIFLYQPHFMQCQFHRYLAINSHYKLVNDNCA